MRQTFAGAILGMMFGGGLGGIVAAFAPGGSLEAAYLRNTLCVVLGAGFGSLTLAVVGGVGAIVAAIQRQSQREDLPPR
jgi:hypothetical protein